MNTTARIIAALALMALVAGCGARGPLEPPPGADTKPPPEPFVLDPVI
ncbi:MAG: lipoprotein [Hyphomicrobiales bacterium]|nr:lipoprotein [Hyphomicrobiales bacterium]